MFTPLLNGLLILGALGSACAGGEDLGEVDDPLGLQSFAHRAAAIHLRTLIVVGTDEDSKLALRLGSTPDILEVDLDDDGTPDFHFKRSKFDTILVLAGDGDDVVRMDESRGVFTDTERVVMSGGDGDDLLLGGAGAETFIGGPGNDTIDGNQGADTAFMGPGDDSFIWDPGDGSDVVEGQGGTDVMVFNGAGASETMDLSAAGERVRFFRQPGAVTMDLDGVERVEVNAFGGADSVTVNDLTGTALHDVAIDLAAAAGDPAADDQADVITLAGTAAPDAIEIAASGDAVVAAALDGQVRVVHGDPAMDRLIVSSALGDVLSVSGSADADTMIFAADGAATLIDVRGFNVRVGTTGEGDLVLRGLGGDDVFKPAGTVTTSLTIDGGEGDDQIFGGAGSDLLIGGPGDDLVDGNQGVDSGLLGDGDDRFIWDPGDGSDLVEGGGGADVLVFFGAGGNEEFVLSAVGERLRLFRNAGQITMDVAGVERVDLETRGGQDKVAVNDLSATSVTELNVDLAPAPGAGAGDDAIDAVTVIGTPNPDVITIAAESGSIVVSGLSALVRLTHFDVTDQLNVIGGGGNDTITAAAGVDALIQLLIDPV